MPVIKCSNGKYRIGSGACVYDTEQKATQVWQAILASGEYAVNTNRISFDFDDTLSTQRGQDLATRLINQGKEVYVITRRQSYMSAAVYLITDRLGIPRSRVKFTNGALKWETVKRLNIGTHYDNNQNEIDKINTLTTSKGLKFEFAESYNDYPQAATDNAKRALKYVEENGWGSCGTPVGKIRANQLAKREPLSRDTIARMSAFARHEQSKGTPYGEGCGGLMWDCWGGDEGIAWAAKKLQEIDKAN